MSTRHGLLIHVILALLAILALPHALADESNDSPAPFAFAPDSAIQAAARRFAAATEPADREAALLQIKGQAQTDARGFVAQLVYFTAHAESTREALVAGAVINRLEIPDATVIEAMIPLLDIEDDALARSASSVLAGFEDRSPDRAPDFSHYRALLEARRREGKDWPGALVKHMLDADPGAALRTFLRADPPDDVAQSRDLLWAQHAFDDVLWKQRYGFLPRDRAEPAAVQAMPGLCEHSKWWVRCYAAAILTDCPALQTPELVASLRTDDHPAVRDMIARLDSNTDPRR